MDVRIKREIKSKAHQLQQLLLEVYSDNTLPEAIETNKLVWLLTNNPRSYMAAFLQRTDYRRSCRKVSAATQFRNANAGNPPNNRSPQRFLQKI